MIREGRGTSLVDPCRVCGSTDSALLFEAARDYITGELFEIRRCARCGVAFTHPQPASLNRFYPPQYRRYGGLTRAVLKFLYDRRARSWVRVLGSSGRALEIGCGSGWMLSALCRQGWQVVGNERAVQSVAYASKVNGVPVFVGGLEALKPEARFDLIVLFQVLEHLPDPLLTLQLCARLLKTGGSLVVAVPNLESWQARLTGPSWFQLDVPRHLFHFSPQSLAYVLRRAGFTIRRTRFASLEHDPYGWEQSLLNLLGFEQNLMTKALMGTGRHALKSPAGIVMALVGGVILIPSLLAAVGSWLAGAGASMEIMAVKLAPVGQALTFPEPCAEPSREVGVAR